MVDICVTDCANMAAHIYILKNLYLCFTVEGQLYGFRATKRLHKL